jgi:hypothetical protein
MQLLKHLFEARREVCRTLISAYRYADNVADYIDFATMTVRETPEPATRSQVVRITAALLAVKTHDKTPAHGLSAKSAAEALLMLLDLGPMDEEPKEPAPTPPKPPADSATWVQDIAPRLRAAIWELAAHPLASQDVDAATSALDDALEDFIDALVLSTILPEHPEGPTKAEIEAIEAYEASHAADDEDYETEGKIEVEEEEPCTNTPASTPDDVFELDT